MPELAEVALMAHTINAYSAHTFHGYERSHVAKVGPDLPIPRCWTAFRITARSRGKELRVDLLPTAIDPAIRAQEQRERSSHASSSPSPASSKKKKAASSSPTGGRVHPPNPDIPLDGPLPLLLRMGMTGHVQAFADPSRTHKHAHLTFLSSHPSPLALCWVDQRQFGRWLVTEDWDSTRSPCPFTEYALWRAHVVDAMEKGKKALDKPLCEVLLDQSLFNGVGNYLRAEICHRAGVNPFRSAREALEGVGVDQEEGSDLLSVCRAVVEEVYQLGYRYSSPNNEGLNEEEPDEKARKKEARVSRQSFLKSALLTNHSSAAPRGASFLSPVSDLFLVIADCAQVAPVLREARQGHGEHCGWVRRTALHCPVRIPLCARSHRFTSLCALRCSAPLARDARCGMSRVGPLPPPPTAPRRRWCAVSLTALCPRLRCVRLCAQGGRRRAGPRLGRGGRRRGRPSRGRRGLWKRMRRRRRTRSSRKQTTRTTTPSRWRWRMRRHPLTRLPGPGPKGSAESASAALRTSRPSRPSPRLAERGRRR